MRKGKSNYYRAAYIKDITINNNKFNLPPVPVPLMGPHRLIPSIGKTLA